MWPDQRMKEWCYDYISSDSSRSRRVRSSRSRRLPSRTSSDLNLRFGFFLAARETASSDTDHLATLARLFVRESVFGLLCWFDRRFLWAGGCFASSRLRRLQNVRLKLGRKMRHTGVQHRLRDFQILADLLQRDWVCIRQAQSLRYSRLRWRRLRQCPRALYLPSLSRSLATDLCGNV